VILSDLEARDLVATILEAAEHAEHAEDGTPLRARGRPKPGTGACS
jgi:hypothetical protein